MLQEEGQGDAARGSSRDAAGDDANDVSPDFLSDGVLQVHDAKYVFATNWVFSSMKHLECVDLVRRLTGALYFKYFKNVFQKI
jgi:hypothetical protein